MKSEIPRKYYTQLINWAGAIAGVLSFVVAVLVWHPWKVEIPRLDVDATTKRGATTLEHFLRSNDGQLVYLDVRCDEYGSDPNIINQNSHCWFDKIDNYSIESPETFKLIISSRKESVRELQVRLLNGDFEPRTGKGQLYIFFLLTPGGRSTFFSQNNGNGSSGTGGLEAKGYFHVLISGSGSLGPPGVDFVELLSD